MFFIKLLIFLCLLGRPLAIPPFGYFQTGNGTTTLLGTSLGQFATNQTFDYIVSKLVSCYLSFSRLSSEKIDWQLERSSEAALQGYFWPTIWQQMVRSQLLSLEAGSFYEITNSNLSQVPAYDFFYTSAATMGIQPLIDWGIITAPQPGLA